MVIYLLNLLWVMGIAISTREMQKWRSQLTKEDPINGMTLVLMLTPLIFVSGVRYGVGSDYFTYEALYHYTADQTFLEIITGREKGFALINWLCARIYPSAQLMFFVCSMITVMLCGLAIRRYAKYFCMSMFLYMATMVYFIPFNIVRQGMATAIMFYNFRYIEEDRKLRYFLGVTIAATLHQSAFIMIPIYFLVRKSSKSWAMKGVIASGVVGYLLFHTILAKVYMILEMVGLGRYMSSSSSVADQGVHILRVLVAMVPMIISLMFYSKLKRENENIDILINFSIINAVFMIMALKDTYFARINLYTEIYNVLLIPYFIEIADRDSKPLLGMLIVAAYFVFMVSQLYTQANLLPYQTIYHLF